MRIYSLSGTYEVFGITRMNRGAMENIVEANGKASGWLYIKENDSWDQ